MDKPRLNALQTQVIHLKHSITVFRKHCQSHNIPLPTHTIESIVDFDNVLSLRDSISSLKRDLLSTRESFSDSFSSLSTFYTTSLEQLQQDVLNLAPQNNPLDDTLQSENSNLKREITSLQSENQILSKQNLSLQKELTSYEEKISHLQASSSTTSRKSDEAVVRKRAFEQKLRRVQFKNDELSRELGEKSHEVNELLAEVSLLKSDVSELQQMSESKTPELEKLRNENLQLTKAVSELRSTVDVISAQKDHEWIEKLENFKGDWEEQLEKKN
ncbi:hypothetical protein GEMRC1_000488 [Eukaryota sp. GEM-RC1]